MTERDDGDVTSPYDPATAVTQPAQVLAPPAQLFAGLEVGLPSLTAVCSHCKTSLGDGDRIAVYAYRPADTTHWSLGRSCCPACAPETIATPTLGTAECRLTARLGVVSDVATQQQRLCLRDPTLVTFSPPASGTRP
jgi:hypothetical protein